MLATGIVLCLDFQKEIVRHHIKNTIVIFNPFFINLILIFLDIGDSFPLWKKELLSNIIVLNLTK